MPLRMLKLERSLELLQDSHLDAVMGHADMGCDWSLHMYVAFSDGISEH